MYRLTVRSHVMIAHSFRGEVFGPAQRLHGATYVVDAEVAAPEVDRDGLLVDIGILQRELEQALEPWRYRNLDELPELAGTNTTTEVLAGKLHARLGARLRELATAGQIARAAALKITLAESPSAWASFEGSL
jgi:6-pyruvoyltetrahydropterin/6-carboxytetrahydropterin synthase